MRPRKRKKKRKGLVITHAITKKRSIRTVCQKYRTNVQDSSTDWATIDCNVCLAKIRKRKKLMKKRLADMVTNNLETHPRLLWRPAFWHGIKPEKVFKPKGRVA